MTGPNLRSTHPVLKCSPPEDDEFYEVLREKRSRAGELSCDEFACPRVLLRNGVPIFRRKAGCELIGGLLPERRKDAE